MDTHSSCLGSQLTRTTWHFNAHDVIFNGPRWAIQETAEEMLLSSYFLKIFGYLMASNTGAILYIDNNKKASLPTRCASRSPKQHWIFSSIQCIVLRKHSTSTWIGKQTPLGVGLSQSLGGIQLSLTHQL